MKNLWTPWRMEHVSGEAETVNGCLFEPETDASHDKKLLLLYKDAKTIILLNRFPYTNGHLLVAPTLHAACISDLSSEKISRLMDMIQESVKILKKHFSPDGFNIGANIGASAGAGVADHLHFHIVPRWSGDHNFMTVVSEIRTIPEHIDRTFDKLLPSFLQLYTTKNS